MYKSSSSRHETVDRWNMIQYRNSYMRRETIRLGGNVTSSTNLRAARWSKATQEFAKCIPEHKVSISLLNEVEAFIHDLLDKYSEDAYDRKTGVRARKDV